MEVDNKEKDKINDKEIGEDPKMKEIQKNKEEYWSGSESLVSETSGDKGYVSGYTRTDARSTARNYAEPKSHGHPKPRKEKLKKKKPVLKGRVGKRVNKQQLKVTNRGASVKRRLKPDYYETRHQTKRHRFNSAASDLTSVSACSRCGYRRRLWVLSPRSRRRLVKKMIRRIKLNKGPVTVSANTEEGSAANMTSPLLVKTCKTALQSRTNIEMSAYSEVTPEMIVESLRRLAMWSQKVNETNILNYMQRNYPVNPDNEELMAELSTKLRIAAELGLVVKTPETGVHYWSLSSALHRDRKIKKNHVTLFCRMYAESMALPLRRNPPKNTVKIIDRENNASNASSKIV